MSCSISRQCPIIDMVYFPSRSTIDAGLSLLLRFTPPSSSRRRSNCYPSMNHFDFTCDSLERTKNGTHSFIRLSSLVPIPLIFLSMCMRDVCCCRRRAIDDEIIASLFCHMIERESTDAEVIATNKMCIFRQGTRR